MEKNIMLNDFKALSPKSMTIDGDVISVETILDFGEIGKLFAFLYIIHECGYSLYSKKENITFDSKDNDSSTNLLAIACFMKQSLEK